MATWPFKLNALQTLCIAVAVAVAVGCGLIISGVALLCGSAWALIAAGGLLVVGSVAAAAVLLHEPDKEP